MNMESLFADLIAKLIAPTVWRSYEKVHNFMKNVGAEPRLGDLSQLYVLRHYVEQRNNLEDQRQFGNDTRLNGKK